MPRFHIYGYATCMVEATITADNKEAARLKANVLGTPKRTFEHVEGDDTDWEFAGFDKTKNTRTTDIEEEEDD